MKPLFRAYDRGIVVASLYAATVVVCVQLFLPGGSAFGVRAALWGVCGFVAGAIGGFSNTEEADSFRRDMARNACDAAMIVVWTANLLLLVNLLRRMAGVAELAQLAGIFAAGTLAGAVIGEPVLLFAGSLSIKGRRPFAGASRLTESLHNPHARFAAKVVLHTVVVGGLLLLAAAAALVVFMIVAFFIAIAILALVLKAMTSEGQTTTVPTFRRRRGEKLDRDRRVVREGWLTDQPTGQRINGDGQLVNEGVFVDQPTGLKIGPDGKLLKEGWLADQETGVRFEDDGRGGQRVIRQGWLVDQDTGRYIDAQGRPMKDGFLVDQEEGFEIDEHGNVRPL
jgi:hypothetical protein